jgi:transglutaminase-like putative cysteine protease
MMAKRYRPLASLITIALFLGGLPASADDDIQAKIASAGDAEKYDADVVAVLDEMDTTVRENGLGMATHRWVVKVLRDAGIASQTSHTFPFDPNTNCMEIRAVRVYRADGTIEEVPLESAVVQPEPVAWGIYWGAQQFVVSVPRLAVGDAVELLTAKTGFNMAYLAGEPVSSGADPATIEPPMEGHWHDTAEFWSSLPIIEKRYIVRLPKDKPLQYEVYNGEVRASALFEGDQVIYTFEKTDIPAFKGEPHMAASSDTQCKLVLATVPDWQTKSRWFWEKNEPSFELTDEIRRTAAEVTAGLETDEEKITALNHWVAENVRYVGSSRGACEGYTTHPAKETLRDRGGVCKDKAGMLVALLRAAGFETYIVLTEAGSRVERVPADQFNHGVVVVHHDDGEWRLYDPTWMPESRTNWSRAEPLQNVVYGTPEGHPLMSTPYFPPEESRVTWEAQTALTALGKLQGTLVLSAIGRPEATLRRFMARRPADERHLSFDEWFAKLSPATVVTEVQAMDPTDFSGPVTVECGFQAENYVLGAGQQRYLRLPMLQQPLGQPVLYDIYGTTDLDERKYPLRIRATRQIQFIETLQLPEGWRVVSVPENKTLDGPAADLKFEINHDASEITYECQVDIKSHLISPDEYGNYKEVIEALNELGEQYVICQVEADRVSGYSQASGK